VAREFDDESSGDEELPLNPDSAAPTATPKSDISKLFPFFQMPIASIFGLELLDN
jgi:hypothetical protein